MAVNPPAPQPQLVKGGTYQVSDSDQGGKIVKFWPQNPATLERTGVFAPLEFDVLPSTHQYKDFSTLVLPPQFGVFDVVVEFPADSPADLHLPEDELATAKVDANEEKKEFHVWISGKPTVDRMPLIIDAKRISHIAFAVYIPRGKNEFNGKLHLHATTKDGIEHTAELPLKIGKFELRDLVLEKPGDFERALQGTVGETYVCADNLYVFFIPHKTGNPMNGNEAKKDPGYAWCTIRAVELVPPAVAAGGAAGGAGAAAAAGGAPGGAGAAVAAGGAAGGAGAAAGAPGAAKKGVQGATVELKVLRDNRPLGYKDINRRIKLHTEKEGYVAYGAAGPVPGDAAAGAAGAAAAAGAAGAAAAAAGAPGGNPRKVLGLRTDWPLIFHATHDKYFPRGHLLRMKTADSPNNLKPLYTADERVEMKMIPLEADALAGKRVLLDPGHGVVYNDPNRRCQEWYVVHRIAWKLAEKLKTCKATVLWTRTAGFGLIAPNQINDEHAPENGEALYKIDIQDPARRQVTVQAANHHPDNLARLSDVLLTNHDNQDAELVVAVAERASLLSDNAAAVQQVAERIVAGLHLHWGIEPNSMVWDAGAQQFNFGVRRLANGHNAGTGSIQWNDATQSYEIAFVPNHPTPLEPQQVHAQPLRIADGDWFAVTEAMLTRLEDRSVRWSYQSEIGGTEVPQFKNQAQTAMGNAAKDYMRQACRWSDFGPADQPWAPGDPMLGMQTKYLHPNQAILPHYGWGIQDRKTYLQNTVCALYLTIHANAMPPAERRTIGSAMLYNSASAPVNQKRLAKIFLKYVDPFDQGTSNGGYYDSGVGLLTANGQHKENYAYTELDFMTSYSPADLVTRNGVRNGAGIQYEEMVGEDFVSNTATQLFNAAVEALLGPQDQGPLDQIYYQYVDKW